jgi:tetratricopeptide (TPR) repeat protein
LQGYPAQARERLNRTIRDAGRKNHPASLGLALSWAPGIFLWIGDLRSAEEHADWLIAHAKSHSLGPYLVVGRAYEGMMAIGRGNPRAGVDEIQGCLGQLHAVRYEMLNTGFKLSLAQGLMAIGQSGGALMLIDEAIDLIEANGDLLYLPEALRVKGNVLLSLPRRRPDEAQICFTQSLDWGRRQGARSWELRTAIDVATLWSIQGERDRARTILQPLFQAFVEGFDTADLQAAEHLLATLR